MRVLVVGSGGREHAYCWKIRQSARCEALYCAPGNGGIGEIAEIVPIGVGDHERIVEWAREKRIDLVVVGPDDPLAGGLVDKCHAAGLTAFGPTRAAAEIEWSKVWAKQFCVENDIPTAAFGTFDSADEAHRYVDQVMSGVVVKADGLALGKGVIICPTADEAHRAIDEIMAERAFGEAGARVVVEELLVGEEVSAFAICDGSTYRMLGFSRDHKPAFDGDRGPNTGGMGAYAPVPWLSPEMARQAEMLTIAPAVRGMARAGRPFAGILYGGLMITEQGVRVIEYNARMGDPEAQVVFPRYDGDLLALLDLAATGRLSEAPATLPMRDEVACCVVLASGGYPGRYETALPIGGLDEVPSDVVIFHAGTRCESGRYVTAGGRVLGVTAFGPSLDAARDRAYEAAASITFDGVHYRRDIGAR